jgi:chromosome segregation ATPase
MSHVAAVAEERGKLVAVRLERSIWQTLGQPGGQGLGQTPGQVAPSVGVEGLDLVNWSGDPEHSGWQELIRRIESKLKSSLWVQRLMHDVEAERARWHAQYETSAARCRTLNAEIATERSERDAALEKAAGLQAIIDADAKARSRLQAAIMELEQRLTGADGKHAETRLLLSEELRQKGTQLAEAQAALAREQDDTARLRTELAAIGRTQADLSARMTDHAALIATRDAHIADLGERLAERATELAGLRTAVSERDAALADLKSAHDAELAALKSERDAEVASLTP